MQNLNKIDLIIQYALITAGQSGSYERRLGAIHLIKYVYLADLIHAKYHNGKTFTGLKWIFHHFGPWSAECFKRIEPALSAIQANRIEIKGEKYGDFIRWEKEDPDLFDDLTNKIDLSVAGAIQRYVREFGNDTYDLLDFVYKTSPMLSAAPEEELDFSQVHIEGFESESPEPRVESTERQKKKQRQKLLDFKKHLNNRLNAKIESQRSKSCMFPPRYDDVFFEGLSKLNEDEGTDQFHGEFIALFGDNIWKSKARHDPELS